MSKVLRTAVFRNPFTASLTYRNRQITTADIPQYQPCPSSIFRHVTTTAKPHDVLWAIVKGITVPMVAILTGLAAVLTWISKRFGIEPLCSLPANFAIHQEIIP